jgi:spore germination protein PE
MLQRSSYVDHVYIKVTAYSSIVQLGDSCIMNGFSRALAVQREAEIHYGEEGNYAAYSTFSEPIPLPTITENISIRSHHLNPMIKVNKVNVIGVSSASILHVGNSNHISMETRVKHIRHLLPRSEEQSR